MCDKREKIGLIIQFMDILVQMYEVLFKPFKVTKNMSIRQAVYSVKIQS